MQNNNNNGYHRNLIIGCAYMSGSRRKLPRRRSEMTSAGECLYARILYSKIKYKLECGPMPNVMAALPNIGGALCSTPQSLADAHY